MLYEPRESINPRIFALRHVLLEELKLRQRRVTGDAGRNQLAALARALDVSYDVAMRQFIVRGSGGVSCEVPLTEVRLFEPRSDATADATPDAWQREDEILRANRALAARVIESLSFLPLRDETP